MRARLGLPDSRALSSFIRDAGLQRGRVSLAASAHAPWTEAVTERDGPHSLHEGSKALNTVCSRWLGLSLIALVGCAGAIESTPADRNPDSLAASTNPPGSSGPDATSPQTPGAELPSTSPQAPASSGSALPEAPASAETPSQGSLPTAQPTPPAQAEPGEPSTPATTPGPVAGASDSQNSPLGSNLQDVRDDYGPDTTFVDIFKSARRWFSDSGLDLDDRGWVRSLRSGQVANTVMVWDGVLYPSGDYVVLYDGEGTFEYQYGGHTQRVTSDGSGRFVIPMTAGNGGLWFSIVATSSQNYLRNIRVIMPGFVDTYEQQIFYPVFLESIRSYSVLRFMDWMRANGSSDTNWTERPKPGDATWTAHGVPVEVLVELANRVAKDPWFSLPHLASDDYVAQFASYVRDHLAQGRKAYVEYSNEVWNGSFEQAHYAEEQGVARGLGAGYEAQLRFYALRATQVLKIWEQVFGGTDRIVRVIASHSANDWASRTILDFQDTAQHADVLAIAPYFGHGYGTSAQQGSTEAMSADQLIDRLLNQDVPGLAGEISAQAEVATQRGIRLVAYEGGQHLAGVGAPVESQRLNDLFDAVNRHPRMKEVYTRYFQVWRENGGTLFVHYTNCGRYSKWGRWGARESLTQTEAQAPKFSAIVEFARDNPRWW